MSFLKLIVNGLITLCILVFLRFTFILGSSLGGVATSIIVIIGLSFFTFIGWFVNKHLSYCQRGNGGCPPYVHPRRSTLIYFSPPFSSSTELLGDKISILCVGFSTLPV